YLGVDLPQQRLEPIYDDAVPGNECRPGMYVNAMEMRVLVYVFLLVPIGNAVRIELCRIELEKSIEQKVALRLRNQSDVSANSISQCHNVIPFEVRARLLSLGSPLDPRSSATIWPCTRQHALLSQPQRYCRAH